MDAQPQVESTDNNQSGSVATTTWPGAFGIYKKSRAAVQLNIGTLLLLALIYLGVSVIFGSIGDHRTGSMSSNLGSLASPLISVLLSTAAVLVLLAGVRGTKISLGQVLKQSLPLYFKTLALTVLTSIISIVSLLLLIVPFFFIVPRLELAMYFLVDKNLGPIEALKASWQATRGNVGKVWGIYGATIAMALIIIVLIGAYFLLMYSAAFAVLYVFLTETQADGSAAAVPAARQETVTTESPTA